MIIPQSRIRSLLIAAGVFLLLLLALTSALVAKPTLLDTIRNSVALTHRPNALNGEEWDEAHKVLSHEAPGKGGFSALLTPAQKAASDRNQKIEHNVVKGQSTRNGRWFLVDFGEHYGSYNPSILHHPTKDDTWIVIAQRDKQNDDSDIFNVELVCEARFNKARDKMVCVPGTVLSLPIASTKAGEGRCEGELAYLDNMIGPHDARIFFGPSKVPGGDPNPYIIFESQHERSCMGMFMQNLRRLTDWTSEDQGHLNPHEDAFFWPTQLLRPPRDIKAKRLPTGKIEKNWFAFWDSEGQMYLHYDIKADCRSFAKVLDSTPTNFNVSADLAPKANDKKCMKRLMPHLQHNGLEWLHQSTNSLSITLCHNTEPGCEPTDDNTFIMTIFQTKTFYFHGVYEPYVMLFRQRAPFEIYGITQKPLWYHGRGKPGGDWTTGTLANRPHDQSEMVFTTSMNFMKKGKGYHGYLDDVIIINFGIEDQKSGGIDVLAEHLLKGLKLC